MKNALRFNEGKPMFSMLDLKSFSDGAKVLEFGAKKYARNNWKLGLDYHQIIDSLLRHLAAMEDGEFLDPESGLPHHGHVQCNAMFLGHCLMSRFDTHVKNVEDGFVKQRNEYYGQL